MFLGKCFQSKCLFFSSAKEGWKQFLSFWLDDAKIVGRRRVNKNLNWGVKTGNLVRFYPPNPSNLPLLNPSCTCPPTLPPPLPNPFHITFPRVMYHINLADAINHNNNVRMNPYNRQIRTRANNRNKFSAVFKFILVPPAICSAPTSTPPRIRRPPFFDHHPSIQFRCVSCYFCT